MGYESTLIIAEPSPFAHEKLAYANTLAVIDLSNVGVSSGGDKWEGMGALAKLVEKRRKRSIGQRCYVYPVFQSDGREKALKLAEKLDPKLGLIIDEGMDGRVTHDMYSDRKLPVMGVAETLAALKLDQEDEQSKGNDYRRYYPAIALLESFATNDSFKHVVVLHYGH